MVAPRRLLAGGGLAIVLAGYALARTGEAIADETGLGSSFVGAVLVAIATSLPEVSRWSRPRGSATAPWP